MDVTLTNGTTREITSIPDLFQLHFGADLVGTVEYARALNVLIAERDGALYDVVIRERCVPNDVIGREQVRAHDTHEAAELARALHLPRAKYAPAFVTAVR